MSTADPPMTGRMALLGRYRISLALVVAVAAVVAGVFTFAGPEYDSQHGSKMIDIAELHHYPLTQVRAAFAKHGLRLRYDNSPSEPLLLSTQAGPWTTDAFYVYYVGLRSGRMSWGPDSDGAWEKRLGNLLVHYGGSDGALLERVQAAVDELD
jgi:hypothetical protein